MSLFRSSLPALAFFLLLGGAAAAGYFVGASRTVADTRIFTCSMHPEVRQRGPGRCPICDMELVPVDAVPKDEGPAITIDPVLVQNMGVRVQTAARGELAQDLRFFGTLQIAQDRLRDITLKFAGFVEKLQASRDGQAITRGEPLFELYAPDLVVAEERLVAAKRGGADSMPLMAARMRLERWDVPAAVIDEVLESERVPRTIVWPSPVTGVVVQRNVTQGSRAEAGATVLRLADLSRLWLDAQLPESQLAAVRPGQQAIVELPSEPGRRREAKVAAIVPVVDERSRTATARLDLPNDDGALQPGMFARVRVRTRTEASALLIPADAVLDTGERQLVWIALGGGRFEPRTVRLGAAGEGGVVQVLDGLAAGESVVVSGQFLIDAESRLREATRRFTAKDRLPTDAPPTGAPLDVDAAAQKELDGLCRSYLALQMALAADRDDGDAWRALRAALLQLATALPAAAQPLAAAVQSALPAADGDLAGDLARHRAAFADVSQRALALFEATPPSASVAKELVVAWCPMKSAGWLQVGMPLHNPYYGSTMPDCGEVKKRLPARGEGKR